MVVIVNLNPNIQMKKYINIMFLILTSFAFTACGGKAEGEGGPEQKGESVEPKEQEASSVESSEANKTT